MTSAGTVDHPRADKLRQVAYATHSSRFEEALQYWQDAFGVGPFFLLDLTLENQKYLGSPTAVDLRLALSYLGDTEIEIVSQTNDAPGPFEAFLHGDPQDLPRGGGIHHVFYESVSYEASKAALIASGCIDAFNAVAPGGRRMCYLDGTSTFGHLVELVEQDDAVTSARTEMHRVCSGWTGRRPLRAYGELLTRA